MTNIFVSRSIRRAPTGNLRLDISFAFFIVVAILVAGNAMCADTQLRFDDDPRQDGWSTEILQSAASEQLSRFAAILTAGGQISAAQLDDLVTDDFRCERLRPNGLSPVFRDHMLTVLRTARSDDKPPAERSYRRGAGLARALSELGFASAADARVKFKVFRIEPHEESFVTHQFFSVFGRTATGSREVHAVWRTGWKSSAGGQKPRLYSIDVSDYEEATVRGEAGTLFTDCTEKVLGQNDSFRNQLADGLDYWNNRIPHVQTDGMQGCAVGDVDGDGLDDLYVCQSGHLPNRLFKQNPDGTATDISAAAGVDWHAPTHSALLLDLDNDGDQDLVIATVAALLIMENDGSGRFRLNTKLFEARDAYTLSAVDYDLDGDLDIFACVYLAKAMRRQILSAPVPIHDARNGGRNVLWRNDGQWQFTDVTREAGLEDEATRRSFSASWEDFDNDGDSDLYVANDYGPNNLFRNDGGHFVDIARLAGVEDQSFGMSASWSDFNHDGWMDLYVANMFSAAGNRIVYQRKFRADDSPEVRRKLQYMARGNSLFQNIGAGRFRDVSESAATMMGLWSWGSTFADLNNDGSDDILVANGYLTRSDPDDL